MNCMLEVLSRAELIEKSYEPDIRVDSTKIFNAYKINKIKLATK